MILVVAGGTTVYEARNNMFDSRRLAERQLSDYDARTPGTMFSEQPALSIEQAYAIQDEVSRLRQARGERLVGYKVGCTSPGIQKQLGIDRPVFGRLFDSDCWPSGVCLSRSQFAGLAIEGELAIRLAADLAPADHSDDELREAIANVFAVIELHHFVIRRDRPTAEEFIANNAIHAGYVYTTKRSTELGLDYKLSIEIGDEIVAAVDGDTKRSVLSPINWLAKELGHHGTSLTAGQTVLCGSVAELLPLNNGRRVVVTTDRFGSVECTIEENASPSGE